jgi:hypothetical protein
MIILQFIFVSIVQAQTQAPAREGRVISSSDNLPIEGVHIVNITISKMAISDEDGGFSLILNTGDTLVASNINFNTKQYVVGTEQFLNISLNPAMIELDEVRVSNLPETEADFRKKIIDMGEVEGDTFVPYGMQPNKQQGSIPKNYDPNYTNSLGYALTKPVSFIVKKLSKSHKNKVKYHQIVANQSNAISNSKKYNPQLVEDLTGLKGDQLTDFIDYLDLDPGFVKRASEYEIAARVLKEFDEYKMLKG